MSAFHSKNVLHFICMFKTILLGYTIDKLAYLEHKKGKLNVDQQSFEQLSIDFTDDQSKMVLFLVTLI